jgi:hypothetical protein
MSNTLLLKRSGVANSVPGAGNIDQGELAINYADGNLFFKNGNSQVELLTSSRFVSVIGNVTGGNVVSLGTVSAVGNITGNYFLGNGSQLTGLDIGNSFGSIAVAGANTVVANAVSATVNFVAGSGISITTNAETDTITFGGASTIVWEVGGSLGYVWDAPATFYDFGSVTEVPATTVYDLGTVVITGVFYPSQLVLPSYTVSSLPTAATAAQFVYVTNDAGGPVPAFSDGTNWRRVTDRAVVST